MTNLPLELDLPDDPAQRSDSLATMLFVAALFHGILILGITFSADPLPLKNRKANSLEVVLLNRAYEKRPLTPDARYLAQQNLTGSGNTENDEGVRVAYGRSATDALPGPEQDGALSSAEEPQREMHQQAVYADRSDAATLQVNTPADVLSVSTGLPGQDNTIEIVATPDTETRLSGAESRQLLISANTRESRIAAYLDSWKRRVEQVGTVNFPRSALATGGQRNPVLEVSIAADGQLQEVIILKSSGNRELDMSAVSILRMAAPFDPFPDYLRTDYDGLTFSYEWQFSAGNVGRVRAP